MITEERGWGGRTRTKLFWPILFFKVAYIFMELVVKTKTRVRVVQRRSGVDDVLVCGNLAPIACDYGST